MFVGFVDAIVLLDVWFFAEKVIVLRFLTFMERDEREERCNGRYKPFEEKD